MSSTFGHSLRISVFGQSHSPAIGVTIDGLPAGVKVDMEEVSAFLARRAPGQGTYATARKESDAPEVLSGLVDGFTCGAPLCAVIHNKDTRSKDYEAMRQLPRPSHADYAAYVKYGQHHDIRGGGHFSGRLTAPLCFAGAVAMQFLRQKGILIGAHISSIGEVEDTPFSPVDLTEEELLTPSRRSFPVLSEEAGEKMLSLIAQVKSEGDSIGGTIQGAAIGLPPGLGEPMFQGVENLLAGALFAIPAMRGVEFGAGFAASQMRGSQHNDPFYRDEKDRVRTRTNRHGGVLGGITSGMPLLFRCAIKPTPSIALPQETVRLSGGEDTLRIEGRHDPCILPRAVPCVEAVTALVLCDLWLMTYGNQKIDGMKG